MHMGLQTCRGIRQVRVNQVLYLESFDRRAARKVRRECRVEARCLDLHLKVGLVRPRVPPKAGRPGQRTIDDPLLTACAHEKVLALRQVLLSQAAIVHRRLRAGHVQLLTAQRDQELLAQSILVVVQESQRPRKRAWRLRAQKVLDPLGRRAAGRVPTAVTMQNVDLRETAGLILHNRRGLVFGIVDRAMLGRKVRRQRSHVLKRSEPIKVGQGCVDRIDAACRRRRRLPLVHERGRRACRVRPRVANVGGKGLAHGLRVDDRQGRRWRRAQRKGKHSS